MLIAPRRRPGDAPRPAADRGDGQPGRPDQRRRPDRPGRARTSRGPRWAGSGAALNGMLARIEDLGRRARGQPGADPAVLRRRQPRAAHPAGLAARQRRAVPAGRAAPSRSRSTRRCAGSRWKPSGWAGWSTTCSGWPGSTSIPASSASRSTSARWPPRCVERARIADPERTWQHRHRRRPGRRGDEELLRRAIDNLLGQRARAHPRRAPPPPSPPPGTATSVVVEVSDDGPGVPADQLAPHLRPVLPRGHPGPAPRVRPRPGHRRRGRRRPRRHRHGRAQRPARAARHPRRARLAAAFRLSGRPG